MLIGGLMLDLTARDAPIKKGHLQTALFILISFPTDSVKPVI